MDSIFNSIKKILGIEPDHEEFDADVIMHINSAFATLNQLGIGPDEGFMIEDDEPVWDDFLLGDNRLNSVKTYIGLKVRLAFDPPATSFGITAMEKQINELEWRLNVAREDTVYGDDSTSGILIIDGGQP
jgi:hypothetical protein